MSRRILCAACVAALPAVTSAQSIEFEAPIIRQGMKADLGHLTQKPSDQVKGALTVLKNQVDANAMMSGQSDGGAVTEGVQRAADWSEAHDGRSAAITDQVLIRFDTSATEDDIADVIREYDLEVTDVYVGLGAINATTDLGEYFDGATTPDQQLQATIDVTNAFVGDPRILAATPNIAIEANGEANVSIENLLTPQIVTDIDFSTEDHIDWGMHDIKVVERWDEPSLFAPRVGVIDVGFAVHEDLAFDGPIRGPKNDHGNHVAGIICGKHNGRGIAGVLPDCQIVAKTGNFLPITSESDNVQSFLLVFSQILLSMDEFVTDRDEVVAFNASLGYNWQSNFGIDPADPGNELIRANIQNQAIFLFPVLEAAQERDILIFSAAGNDSGIDDPRDAVFASPFNWAARTACEQLGNCSGVIVEAHGEDHSRAPFSNVNGDISCPGVDVLSAVSSGPADYAAMSGTSMASPYCTGGYVMFSMLRPNYRSQEALACLIQSGEPQPHGTPKMDIDAALAACPPRI